MTYEKDSLHDQKAADRSIRRIKEMIQLGMSQQEMIETLNAENYRTIRQKPWSMTNLRQVLWRLRHSLKSWYGLSGARCGLDTSAV